MGIGDGVEWCQVKGQDHLGRWAIGEEGLEGGTWVGMGGPRHRGGGPGPRHSLQQLEQPLPILQPEVLGQVFLLHDAQTHGGGGLRPRQPGLRGKRVGGGAPGSSGVVGACVSFLPAFQGPEGGCLSDSPENGWRLSSSHQRPGYLATGRRFRGPPWSWASPSDLWPR